MRVTIKRSTAKGAIDAPPSKSAAHRALICAALSHESTIYGVDYSGDITSTLSCLEALGASVEREEDSVTLGGLNPAAIGDACVDCGESGSTLRFLLPLCLISGGNVTLRGTKKLLSRPLDVYEEICRRRGFTYFQNESGITVNGRLTSGVFDVSMAKSSQFVTGLLFALSCLNGKSEIRVAGHAESLSYVDMTLSVMRDFGADVAKDGMTYVTYGATRFKSLSYDVERDYSNAAFLDALGFVGGDVKVNGLSPVSAQGDRIYPKLFCDIKSGRSVDLSDCPDLAPVLFALAAFNGGGHFTGTRRLAYKESDRAAVMKEELSAFGVTLDVGENTVDVAGSLRAPSRTLSSHNDHRIAMALSVLCSVTGGEIDDALAVNKSYPGFFRDIGKLGIEVETHDA